MSGAKAANQLQKVTPVLALGSFRLVQGERHAKELLNWQSRTSWTRRLPGDTPTIATRTPLDRHAIATRSPHDCHCKFVHEMALLQSRGQASHDVTLTLIPPPSDVPFHVQIYSGNRVAIEWRSRGDRVAFMWQSCVCHAASGQLQQSVHAGFWGVGVSSPSCPGSRILDAGAWIQEPRSRNPGSWSTDPGSGILITDPGSLKHHAPCRADHNVPAQNVPPCCAGSKCAVRNMAGRAGAKRARAGPNLLCRAS